MRTKFLNYQFSSSPLFRGLPAFLVMLAIFLFSAHPSTNLFMPLWERVLYKAGHVMGYALLSASYWRAFRFQRGRLWLAWLLAVLYAATDEFHQSFVPGRHPAAFDVLVYDNLGALASLWILSVLLKQEQPASKSLAARKTF